MTPTPTTGKEEKIKTILNMYSKFVWNVKYDMGGYKEYRREIKKELFGDDYPASDEDFIDLLGKII